MSDDRISALRRQIATHKSVIRWHRAALCRVAAELARLSLAGTGIKPVQAKGKNPWPTSSVSIP